MNGNLEKELQEIEEDLRKKEKERERTWRDIRILWHSVSPHVKCYDEETEVLTSLGWQKIRDIDPNLQYEDHSGKRNHLTVLTLNPETFEMEYQRPLRKFVYEWNGTLYSLNHKQVNLLVTPNHQMFIAKRQRDGSWRWRFEEASRNLHKEVRYKKTGIWKGNNITSVDLPLYSGRKEGTRRVAIEDFLEFLGYYLSEGYVHHNPRYGNYVIAIRQNRPKLLKMGKALERVVEKKVLYQDSRVQTWDKGLWEYLIRFGYSHQKYIPDWIKNLNPRLLKIFLKAFEEGDGTRYPRAVFTSSTKLKDDLQEIILKCGFGSNSSIMIPEGKKGNLGFSKYPCWRISINQRTEAEVNKSKDFDELIPYEGKVYCLEVPNHTLLVRREGKTVFSGNSGYGIVTKNVVSRLLERGLIVMVSAYYGLQAGGFLKVGEITTFPTSGSKDDTLGFSTARGYREKFGSDIIILHTDFWIGKPLTDLVKETVAYTPLDHEDYAEEIQDVLRSFFKVAIPSKHGCREAEKYGVEATFIPHGVDLSTYHPLPKPECKRLIQVDPDTFVVGMVGANNDMEPRKGWDKMFTAVRIFLDRNPEMQREGRFRVFAHTDAQKEGGYNLKLLAKRTGIAKYLTFQDPFIPIMGLPETLMNRIYNSFDVLMNLSRREGFCLPILEAQACRVPTIATDFSAMTERLNYGKCGWLVKPATTVLSPLGGITSIPDEFKAAEALEEAVYNQKKRERFSKLSLAYAKTQTWDTSVEKHWLPFLEETWTNLEKDRKGKRIYGTSAEKDQLWEKKRQEVG